MDIVFVLLREIMRWQGRNRISPKQAYLLGMHQALREECPTRRAEVNKLSFDKKDKEKIKDMEHWSWHSFDTGHSRRCLPTKN